MTYDEDRAQELYEGLAALCTGHTVGDCFAASCALVSAVCHGAGIPIADAAHTIVVGTMIEFPDINKAGES
jgi:hypothetical protein